MRGGIVGTLPHVSTVSLACCQSLLSFTPRWRLVDQPHRPPVDLVASERFRQANRIALQAATAASSMSSVAAMIAPLPVTCDLTPPSGSTT
jgi:hypothetical protein